MSFYHEHEQGRPQGWATSDADLRSTIEQAVDRMADELSAASFVGAYLHGSLSTGSFYRPKSDVDILFVVKKPLQAEQRGVVSRTLCDLSDELPLVGDYEVSVLKRDDAQHFHHPLPYELHYSHSTKRKILSGSVDFSGQHNDPDLAVHCTAVRKRGVCLRGAPIGEVFGPVPVENYRDSIFDDLQWILEDDHLLESPFYGVLNCCRVLALQAEGWDQVFTKDEGGEWAIRHLPGHHAIVSQALACYRSAEPVPDSERQTDGHTWDATALSELRAYVQRAVPEAV